MFRPARIAPCPAGRRSDMRILVILDCVETALPALETAGGLACRLGCHDIRVLQPQPATDPDYQSPDEGMPGNEARLHFARTIADRATQLHRICTDWAAATGHTTDTHWVERAGDIRATVAHEASGSNLVVMGRPHAGDAAAISPSLAGALYDARAAVVMAPLRAYATIGLNPVVAWHASPGLERAIASAWPLLEQARKVTVIIGESRLDTQPDPALVATLRHKGVTVAVERFISTDTDVGARIRALAAQGDLLVMGAYGRPHFLEWLFGGPTLDILTHALLPLLTHH
ncbi:universal stress protein [Komagataeibacter rhaeticus]|uniref:universal stress protein n=1 Tax=Komagataeibacter rhaeticus TaxID=215221 RepID=UPI000A3F2293|nr:universal stress protein [Komagataeibacter rhaeticus]